MPKPRHLLSVAVAAALVVPAGAAAQGVTSENAGGSQYAPTRPSVEGPQKEPQPTTSPKSGGGDGDSSVAPPPSPQSSQPTAPAPSTSGTTETAPPTEGVTPTGPTASELEAQRERRQARQRKLVAERRQERADQRRQEAAKERRQAEQEANRSKAQAASVPTTGDDRIGPVFPILLGVALVGSLALIVRRRGGLGGSEPDERPDRR